ncbi:hypothetical protein [Methanobrevibacter sp.]|uniref:hypothetical protein n=1 Tax=Methanobrevibacter sp. TaxID=66852 RepID=UPI0025E9D3EC|nr:hypothetical protein [Methanobrevibacter sp.]MBQ2665929.1 hypothetical protein [Methanobrevibacter sp.]
MKFENVLIIALIVLIFAVIGAYIIMNGTGTATVNDESAQQPIANIDPNTDTINTATQSSSGASSSESDTSSGDDSASDSAAVEDASSSSSADSSTPQAGQAEGTYDPADFD